jgi:hypothetical protein
MKRFRPRLTYANVIASLALFIALGGAAMAAGLPKNSVGPNQIKKGAVTAKAIRKQAVTAGKIAPKAVVAGKLGPNAVLPGNLGPGIIDSSKISAGAVTAEKIKNNVITTTKITNGAVTSQKLATNGVGTTNLADSSVTAAKIGKGAVTAEKLAPEVLNNVNPLKSGQTLRGVFDVGGINPTLNKAFSAYGSVTFQQALATTPTVTIIPKGGAATAACPGVGTGETTPAAAAGNLCIYLTTSEGLDTKTPLEAKSPNRLGLGLIANAEEKEGAKFAAIGVWAVTAP